MGDYIIVIRWKYPDKIYHSVYEKMTGDILDGVEPN